MTTLTFVGRGLLLGALAAMAAAPSAAQEGVARLRLQSLAASCAHCHGTEGRPVAGSIVPGLAGRPAAETVAQMAAYKAASTRSTVMGQIAHGYSDAQIRELAAYFAGVAP